MGSSRVCMTEQQNITWRFKCLCCCCCCSVAHLCLTLCNPLDCSMPGFPVLHHLLEFAQTHIHWVGDAIQPSRPLIPPGKPLESWICLLLSFPYATCSAMSKHQCAYWYNRNSYILRGSREPRNLEWWQKVPFQGQLVLNSYDESSREV